MWTRLEETANAGDTSITLQEAVNWEENDEITIASTSNHLTGHAQNEKKTIQSISNGGRTLELDVCLDIISLNYICSLLNFKDIVWYTSIWIKIARSQVVHLTSPVKRSEGKSASFLHYIQGVFHTV